jgi:pyridoxamine 5'-phosphate oxidase
LSYSAGRLTEELLAPTWLEQLQRWYDEAAASPAIDEPNALQLATVSAAGDPDVRTVLARDFNVAGVAFYTNYDSAKGRQLAARPRAAAVFSWLPLQRQVRLRGAVSRVGPEETQAYFAGRPRDSQLGAWASPQSAVLSSRAELEARYAAEQARFGDSEIPPPPNWGGYRLSVEVAEFWQGRPSRLHDRLRYRADGASWVIERLAP